MTTEELDAIEARATAATAGPWSTQDVFAASAVNAGAGSLDDGHGLLSTADAAFVAAARADVPALVAEVRRLRALPVTATCSDCAYSMDTFGDSVAWCECGPKSTRALVATNFDGPPPPACPLRGAT